MSIALRLILDNTSQEDFLNWAQSSIPMLAPSMLKNFSSEEHAKIAYWMGVSLWNAAPQPSNHFKPLPIANA